MNSLIMDNIIRQYEDSCQYDLLEHMSEEESEEESETEDEEEEEEENMFSKDFQYYEGFKIHPAIDCSKLSVLKMVLIYFMRHNLTLVALEDLLKLINCIIGETALFTSNTNFLSYFLNHKAKK